MDVHPRLASHLRSSQVSRVVYGSIIGLALVLTLEAHPPGVAATIVTLLASALSVALAELYSELLGGRARASLGGPRESASGVVRDVTAVGFGIAFPSMLLLGAAPDGCGPATRRCPRPGRRQGQGDAPPHVRSTAAPVLPGSRGEAQRRLLGYQDPTSRAI
jgi:hypothetical protein